MIAGEASGDLHGAKLASALLKAHGALKLEGVGGKQMSAAGVQLLGDIRDLGVVGVVEVLGHWRSIWGIYRQIRERLNHDPPDLVILIDYPDFNLRVARLARKKGIPIVYYISPQVWAWRPGRIKTIARLVDQMLVIFPFEKELYDTAGVRCEFVGHPLLDDLDPLPPKPRLREQFGLDPNRPTVGILPGSRRQEVQRFLPVMLRAIKRLKTRIEPLQVAVAVAPSLELDTVRSVAALEAPEWVIAFIPGQADEVISASDAVVVASGTATLQAAIHETPMVIVYKVSFLTYLLGKMLVRTEHIGLVNVVAQKRIVPELLQFQMRPEAIETEVYRMLTDPVYTEGIKKGLAQVRTRLGGPGASSRAAKLILELLDQKRQVVNKI